MAPTLSSPYSSDWGLSAIKLKSKRSLGNLRNRIAANFRSANKSLSSFHSARSLETFFESFPSKEDYEHYPYRPLTSSTIMTGTEPDIPEEPLKEAEEMEAERSASGSPRKLESPSATSISNTKRLPSYDNGDEYVVQSVKPQPISITHIRTEKKPDSSMFHRLSLSLTGSVECPKTPENRRSRSNSMQEHSGNSRTCVNPSPDSCSTMTHFPDIQYSLPESPQTENVNETNLPPLQTKSMLEDIDQLDAILEDDPSSFELLPPATATALSDHRFSLEKRAEEMFSRKHLEEIFADPSSMLKFTNFLSFYRPYSVSLLLYYLNAVKSVKAINYANSIISRSLTPIKGQDFTNSQVDLTINQALERRVTESFDTLVRNDLPAYITHIFLQVASLALRHRVIGTMPVHLREASEGLAEVFCLTDPSRADNPIVFASEEFHRTTQYGVEYAIGRNCRFLQGPNTSRDSVRRIKEAAEKGVEVNELLLNYRRDGSAFMNLLTVSPLYDSKGKVRYFIGGQVDVSGLCKDATNLDSLRRVLKTQTKSGEASCRSSSLINGNIEDKDYAFDPAGADKAEISFADAVDDAFQEMSEMFSDSELEVTRRCGGRIMQIQQAGADGKETPLSFMCRRPHLGICDPDLERRDGNETPTSASFPKKTLTGLFQNYLLVRSFPSLRILFASPALRVPGILQSPFLSRIGGSSRVRSELSAAMAAGRGVTAKVRWVSGRPGEAEGSARWVHCTPLLGRSGGVGVWMVVIVDEEGYEPIKRFKAAPPVAQDVRRASMTTGVGSWESQDGPDFGKSIGNNRHTVSIVPSLGVLPDP